MQMAEVVQLTVPCPAYWDEKPFPGRKQSRSRNSRAASRFAPVRRLITVATKLVRTVMPATYTPVHKSVTHRRYKDFHTSAAPSVAHAPGTYGQRSRLRNKCSGRPWHEPVMVVTPVPSLASRLRERRVSTLCTPSCTRKERPPEKLLHIKPFMLVLNTLHRQISTWRLPAWLQKCGFGKLRSD